MTPTTRRADRSRTPRAFRGFEPRPFRPASWLRGAHLQTLVGRLLRPRATVRYRRERWTTEDGDFLDLDFADPGPGGPDVPAAGADGVSGRQRRDGPVGRPTVLVLHGLEGGSDSGYVLELVGRLGEAGLGAVALNFRSRSGEPNRHRRFYHSGETDDLAHVLGRLREERPDAPLAAVGFSLGGNVLLKYLGERGETARDVLDAAVAVSVPYRLGASARRMERGLGPMYAAYFLRSLRASVRAKARERGHDFDLERLARVRSLREFDDAFTAPVHGFHDAADYYRRSSSARFLPDVRVPTLLLQSRDDPFLPEGGLPEAEMRQNPWLLPVLVDRGGHVGFVEGPTPWEVDFWAEAEAVRFLAAALDTGGRDPRGTAIDERASDSDRGTTI